MSKESPNLSLHNANFGIFIARMVPEIFAFLGTDTARPDFEITTFIWNLTPFWNLKLYQGDKLPVTERCLQKQVDCFVKLENLLKGWLRLMPGLVFFRQKNLF